MRPPNPATRAALLDGAMRLMLAKGFVATSVDEICAAARVTKGSFFHYFRDKEALGLAVLDHYWDATNRGLEAAPFNQETDPLRRLYAYIDLFIAISRNPRVPKSCLFGNFAQELSTTHPRLRARCAEGFSRWARAIKRDLDAARAAAVPAVKVDTKSMADHFVAIYEGSLILVKATNDPSVLARNMRHFKRYVASMFGQPRPR
jgi:TetR/AcrR family transcriptional repressor of nem operon